MKNFLVLILCLSLAGLQACSAVAKNYLYQPSVIQRGTDADGNIAVSDVHILSFANDVKLAWQKRTQIAKGIEVGAEGTESVLNVIPIIGPLLGFAVSSTPIGTIVSVVSSLIGKLTNTINPVARGDAYLGGIERIDTAVANYYAALRLAKPGDDPKIDKRTMAGEALANATNLSKLPAPFLASPLPP